jgi:hypothetical protein
MYRHARHMAWLGKMPTIVIAIVLGTAGLQVSDETGFNWWSSARAEEPGHSGGHSGGAGGSHGGSHGGGHTDHGDEEGDDHGGGHTPGPKGYGSHGTHRGGHGHDVARGGGKAVEYRVLKGRRPVWAQEGIPEVELGRLNVSRAPGRVLARAEGEALATYSEAMAALYSLDAEQAAALLSTSFRDVTRYDSPLQNLALYKDVMTFGDTQLRELDPDVTPASQLDLAAIFLGSASDKTIPISEDTVIALNRILGLVELDADDRSTLATKAETVRAAILEGHGPTEEH